MPRSTAADRIIAWNERRGRSRRGFELTSDVQELGRRWSADRASLSPFADFVPLRLVTTIEVFVRESMREIIDSGPPYLERAEDLFKAIRLDFRFATSLQGRRVTIGDIIGHSVSISDVEQIAAILEKLLPGYRKALPAVHDRWEVEIEGKKPEPIIADVEKMFFVLRRLFEVRHVVAHELPRRWTYNEDETSGFLEATLQFMQATDEHIGSVLRGDEPLTQVEMNIRAGNELEAELADLKRVFSAVEQTDDVDQVALKDSQAAWEVFADAEASLRASLVQGGSMYGSVWASAKSSVVRTRIEQLRWWLDREEGDV
jgi:uncharacterized protein YecT (DUF1311 family)